MPISDYIRTLREKVGTMPIMMPGVCVVCLDADGRVLLHRSRDTGTWHLIGGAIDPGEEPADAAVREILEETGVAAVVDRLINVYAGPDIEYPNGDIVRYTTIGFRCRTVEPHPTPRVADDESLEVRFFSIDTVPALPPLQQKQLAATLGKQA